MERLCGRPGCSDRAAVAYGMRAEDLVFWIDVLPDDDDGTGGVLCRRHADSMVVPRGWTLDDLRDPDLHLFRPPPPEPTRRSRRARPAPHPTADATGEQLRLDPAVIAAADERDRADRGADRGADGGAEATEAADGPVGVDEPAAADAEREPWTPSFDEADDLGGLLAADSPLLSRAFRTADRTGQ